MNSTERVFIESIQSKRFSTDIYCSHSGHNLHSTGHYRASGTIVSIVELNMEKWKVNGDRLNQMEMY